MSARRPAMRVSVSSARPVPAARGLAACVTRVAPRAAVGTVAIALVSDARMRALNRGFRGVDAATDVLSFPGARQADSPHLGDIAIAVGVARRQAREHGHRLAEELRILAIHGLLHLLGYDHERDRGEMRRVEERLRRRAGLTVGLIARSRMSSRR